MSEFRNMYIGIICRSLIQLKSNQYQLEIQNYKQNTKRCQTRSCKLFSKQEQTSTQYLTSLSFESENDY